MTYVNQVKIFSPDGNIRFPRKKNKLQNKSAGLDYLSKMSIRKINLKEKFSKFSDHWNPKIIGELNGQYVKLAKIKGEFIWHSHEHEDELFWVMEGKLDIELRDQVIHLFPGEMVIIPKGVEHRPVAIEEALILLFEPASTLNTGNHSDSDLTKAKLDWI